MKTHFAWRPHLDRGSLFNPFVPSERTSTLGHAELSEAYGDEVQAADEAPPSARQGTPEASTPEADNDDGSAKG